MHARRIVVKNFPSILDNVLADHGKHMYLDLSWVVLQEYVLKDTNVWAQLVAEHFEVLRSPGVCCFRVIESVGHAHTFDWFLINPFSPPSALNRLSPAI